MPKKESILKYNLREGDKVQHELRVTSCELRVEILKAQVQIYEL